MKEIKDYPGYYITSCGNVYCNNPINGVGDLRSSSLRLLKQKISNTGYHSVVLYNKFTKKKGYKRVHRLVAEAFIPNVSNLPSINHIDENKSNNNVENLEWCSHQYNSEYTKCKQNYILRNKVSGEIIEFFNLYKKCKELNISRSSLYSYNMSGDWILISPPSLKKDYCLYD